MLVGVTPSADSATSTNARVTLHHRGASGGIGSGCHSDEEVAREKGATLTWELAESDGGTRLTAYVSGAGPATAASADESNDEIYLGLKRHLEGAAA